MKNLANLIFLVIVTRKEWCEYFYPDALYAYDSIQKNAFISYYFYKRFERTF